MGGETIMQVGELWVKLGLDKTGYDNGINNSKSQASGLSGFIKNAFSFTVGMGMFDLLKTGIKSAWDMSIGFNSEMQQNGIAFESMLGSAEKAGKFLKTMQDMAAATPFELNDLTSASKKLLAFGFSAEQIPKMITSIGDAASGLGMSGADGLNRIGIALGQMGAKGRVQASEMMQLTEAGIPAWDILAKAMGISTAEVMKLSEKGLIPADKAIGQLVDGMESRFPNMMAKQSKSFAGLMSTLKDNVQITLGGVLKPQFEYLTNNVLPGAIDKVSKFGDVFKSGGLGEAMKTIIPAGLVDGLAVLGNAIEGVFGWIKDNGPLVSAVIAGMTSAFVTYKLAVMASIVQQEIHNALLIASALKSGGAAAATLAMEGATGKATVAQKLLNIAQSINPMGILVLAIVALVGAFIYLWNTNEGFRKAVLGMWTALSNGVVGAVSGIRNGIVNGFNSAINFITSLPGKALGWGKDFVMGLVNGITGSVGRVVDAVSGLAAKIKSYLHFSVPDEGPLTDYESWMPDFIGGMAKGIESNKHKLVNTIKGLAGNMTLGIKGVMSPELIGNLSGGSSGNTTTINLNGNYGFSSKEDMNYFMNQLAIILKRSR